MKTIEEIDLDSKRVLIRCDLDVPMNEDGTIADDHRIKAAISSIEYLLKKNAKVIIAGHMGRPGGKAVSSLSLKPVADRISLLLRTPVKFLSDCVGDEVTRNISSIKNGEIVLLENVRFHEGEENNDPSFSKNLASLCDVYVNNAFATAHRAHASTAGIANYVSVKAAGFTLRDEVNYFNKSCKNPERPLLAIFGGAKVSTKIKAIKNVGKSADVVIIGGAMANTFLKAKGHSIGNSLFEEDLLSVATDTLKWFQENDKQLLLPIDVITSSKLATGVPTSICEISAIPDGMLALDIGPKSLQLFKAAINSAKTIIWNGPMGVFEIPEYSAGTFGIVDALSEANALTVVGGGDTDLALNQRNAFDKMDFVSTAGGAFMALLEGKTLPALSALEM
ncbi:MAG TPA: phosphoglycerate kinase [Oligoflexia bacterium]|nr:phosphoglycerate kinase [Oligoflexia bacterium]HMP49163.1 phosphoglycerate kinase [Oligoflexia bacterium]